jgi:hypothetical protein
MFLLLRGNNNDNNVRQTLRICACRAELQLQTIIGKYKTCHFIAELGSYLCDVGRLRAKHQAFSL